MPETSRQEAHKEPDFPTPDTTYSYYDNNHPPYPRKQVEVRHDEEQQIDTTEPVRSNKRLLKGIGVATLGLTVAFTGGYIASNSQSERSAPNTSSSGDRRDTVAEDMPEFTLSDSDTARLSELTKHNILEQYDYAKEQASNQGSLDESNPDQIHYETNSLGGGRLVSTQVTETPSGSKITVTDHYKAPDGFTKDVTLTFTTPKKVDNPVDSFRKDQDLKIGYYGQLEHRPGSGTIAKRVTFDGNKLRGYSEEIDNEGKLIKEDTWPKESGDNPILTDWVSSYQGAHK